MNKKIIVFEEKHNVDYYVDVLTKGDLIIFKNGTLKIVAKHRKGSHIVSFDDGRENDLYVIFDSIQSVMTQKDDKGNATMFRLYCLTYEILHYFAINYKLHAYPDVIAAILSGDEYHYISDYCSDLTVFGAIPNAYEEDVTNCLTVLEIFGLARQKISKHGKPYYYVRKDRKRWHREFVWYVCYGSNLCKERFMCYITGKENKKYGIAKGDACKNQSPIVAEFNYKIPYEMYFGNSSGSWDGGGVCFIKPTQEKDEKKWSFATAYLITKEQYEHVWKREGKSMNWYGNEISLEPIIGLPTKTFTSEVIHSYNKPCERYLKVVKNGLIEWGLPYKVATQYLFCKTGDIK